MSRDYIEIDGVRVGPGCAPFLVAEISANHQGSINQGKRLIELAKKAGASAVKLQSYTPDTITIDCNEEGFWIRKGPWAGYSLYQLYKKAQTPFEWHGELFAHARNIGITIFSTPFDHTAVELLETLDAPAYKIASFEIVDLPLIERVASTGKPVILSTGMATLEEISEAVHVARDAGCCQLALLHCVSSYPTPASEMNLSKIVDLKARFKLVTGLSDHSLGTSIAIAGVALGASIVEKHFIKSRHEGGLDAGFSMEPEEFGQMVQALKDVSESVGKAVYRATRAELDSRFLRKSIYIVKDIAAGETLTEESIRVIRPGLGLAPKYWKTVLGKKANQPLIRGTPLDWSHME